MAAIGMFAASIGAHASNAGLTAEMSRQMQEHIERAREKDGQLLAAFAAKEAAWQEVELARTALGLKITASGSAFYTDRSEQLQGGQNTADVQRDFVAQQIVIAARKPLYRKKEQVSIEQALAKYQESTARARQAELDLSGKVLLAWIEILAARDMMMLSQAMLEMSETIVQETQRRYDSGELTIDQLGLEIARLQQRQADWIEAVAKVEISEKTLTDLSGSAATVPKAFSLESAIPNPSRYTTRSEVEEQVKRLNHLVAAARYGALAAELEIQKAQAARYPTLEAFASVTAGENDVASYIKNEHRVGVQLVVPLYTSGAFEAATLQAQALLRQSQAQAFALESALQDRAWRAFIALQVALMRMDSSRIAREAAELRVQAMRRGFEAGESSRAEVGRAQAEYQSVRQQSVKEKLEYARAWIELSILTAGSLTASPAAPAAPTTPRLPSELGGNLVQR